MSQKEIKTESEIAGYILTGGKSRRMEGKDKLFLEFGGESFYHHIRRALAPFSSVYLSVSAENRLRCQSLSLPMVVDRFPDLGPMGGIYSGLLACGESALFVVACDMPLIRRETVEQVVREYRRQVTVVRSGSRLEPLFGIYPKTVLPVMEEMIRERNYRMRDLLSRTPAQVIPLEENNPVAVNINTDEEYLNLRCARQTTSKE